VNSIAMQPNLLRDFDLPWVTQRRDRHRFIRFLGFFLALTLLVGGVIPQIELPEIEREQLEKLPPALAQIKLDKPEVKIPPPPPPPDVEEKIEPKVEQEVPKEAPVKPVEKKIEPVQPSVSDAREKAKVSGLLAFQDAFADMRDAVDVSSLTDTAAIQQGAGESASIDRSLLTAKTGSRSAGVNVAEMSRKRSRRLQKTQARHVSAALKKCAACLMPTRVRSLQSTTERSERIPPYRARLCLSSLLPRRDECSIARCWIARSPIRQSLPKLLIG